MVHVGVSMYCVVAGCVMLRVAWCKQSTVLAQERKKDTKKMLGDSLDRNSYMYCHGSSLRSRRHEEMTRSQIKKTKVSLARLFWSSSVWDGKEIRKSRENEDKQIPLPP